MNAAELIAIAVKLYAAAGMLFGILFVLFGVSRIDAASKGTGAGFRLIILPGTVVLWPMLLLRWVRS